MRSSSLALWGTELRDTLLLAVAVVAIHKSLFAFSLLCFDCPSLDLKQLTYKFNIKVKNT